MRLHFLKSVKMAAVTRMFFLCVLVSALAGIVCSPAQAATYYVNAGATAGGNTGADWANAYTNLQSALNLTSLLSGDEIWVAAGTYSPGPSAVDSFYLVQGVGIYGGFNGTETLLTDRNWTANETILDGGGINEHVVRCGTVTSTAVLDGFTIKGGIGGQFNIEDPLTGGGLYNSGGSPIIRNCTFSGNTAEQGAGIYNNEGSSPIIENCTFSGNTATYQGGGIYSNFSSPIIENCAFSGNTALDGNGGGIFNSNGSSTITNCTFSGNTANSYGGGIYNGPYGSLSVTHCTLIENSAVSGNGGGIYNSSMGTLTVNHTIVANSSGGSVVTDLYNESGGTVTSNYNIVESMSGYPSGANDIIGNQPSLNIAPLADNGGTTQTCALLPGSVAIDAGNPSATDLPSYDQRGAGFPRVKNGRVDIGAYESDPAVPEMDILQNGTAIASGGSFDFGEVAVNTDSGPVVFVISNTGTADLILSGTPSKISLSGANASEFSVDESGLVSPVQPSGDTAFSVTFAPAGAGSRTAVISIANNDDDENPYVVNLTGTGAQVAPAAADDTYSTDKNTLLNISSPGVLGNDTGSSLIAVLVDSPIHASSFDLSSDGSFFYFPNPDFSGTDSFTYKAVDGSLESQPATVTIAVNPESYRLSVSITGGGSVSGDGIVCPSDCYEYFPAGQTVWLTAYPYSGYILSGWNGVQGYSGNSASVVMNSDKTVTVTFAPSSPYYPDDPHYPTDLCPYDPHKTEPGICGCGVADTDTDGDGIADCLDQCPNDPHKTEPGICGCGVPDTDTDGDGTADCKDNCPNDPAKTEPGICGCGVSDALDTDGDGTPDCIDLCLNDPNKTEPGICGCGKADTDTDGDSTPDCKDNCPNDPSKTEPGICGCGVPDTDTDGDGAPDCIDLCPHDSSKTEPGICGCGVADTDTDGDSVIDCPDNTPPDPPRLSNAGNHGIYPPGSITLKTGPFYDKEGDSHLETLWEIYRADNACGEPFMEHASSTDLTLFAASGLLPGVKYVWKAGFRDSGSRKLVWSEEMLSFIVGENAVGESLHSDPGTEVSDYRMFSFPLWHEDSSSEKILASVIQNYDKKYFRIGTYNPETGQYVEYGPNLVFEPGRSYWFLTREGMEIPQTGIPVSTEEDSDVKLVFDLPGRGWNMVAVPNPADYVWEDVEIVIKDGCISIPISQLPEVNPYISKKLWQWDEDGYSPDADRMEKNKGYWVMVKQKGIWLRFRADKQIRNAETSDSGLLSRTKKRIWKSMTPNPATAGEENSPPMPPGGFTESGSSSDSGGGGCFIRSAQEK